MISTTASDIYAHQLIPRQLKSRDLIWIVETTSLRGYYLVARVVKLKFGSDAVARTAEVETTYGNLVRLIVKLAFFLSPPDINE